MAEPRRHRRGRKGVERPWLDLAGVVHAPGGLTVAGNAVGAFATLRGGGMWERVRTTAPSGLAEAGDLRDS